jgi:hypothetical protein
MASTALTTPIRLRLSTFAKGIARPFTDSRRRNFVTDMLTGLVAAGHVHLTAVARGISRGAGNIHSAATSPVSTGRPTRSPTNCSGGPPRWSPTTPSSSPTRPTWPSITPGIWRDSGGSTTAPIPKGDWPRGTVFSRRMCGSGRGNCSRWWSNR